MEKRSFGSTGQQFPILSFGAQRIVDEHQCTEEEAIQIVNRAIDQGITYFDTAPSYSDGQSEERLGKALARDVRRNEVWIATKTVYWSAFSYQGASLPSAITFMPMIATPFSTSLGTNS